MMSDDLSWSNHLTHITNKAYKKLGLLRRSLCYNNSTSTKKRLYVLLIRSQLLYCSQIWHPYLRKDIKLIENVQRHATKFILNEYSSDYKSRFLKLNLLPLTMIYDISFFVKSLKQPSTSFNITDFVSFSHNSTRSGSHLKLVHQLAKANRFNQFYFTRLPRIWTALPPMDLSKSYITIVNTYKENILGMLRLQL